jgi:bacillaene synthase trans-acting acyltransferase
VVFGRLPVRVPFHSALVEPMRAPWLQRYGQLAADTAAE